MRSTSFSLFYRLPAYLIAITILAVSVFFEVSVSLAQSPLRAQVDRTTIAADEQVTLTVTVTGEVVNIPRPDLSNLTDFRVVGTRTSTQISIINGDLTSQGIYIYSLQPLREGNLVIPPVSVEIKGQLYQTDPLNIEVVGGNTPFNPPEQDFPSTEAPSDLEGQLFVEAEVNNPTPYLGQQIIYTFRLYQAVNLIRQPDYQSPSFTNFWGKNVLSQPHYKTSADGRDYLVTEIRTALFPANIGQITIDPAKLVVSAGFFEPDIVLETDPITIDVQPLPDPSPDDFSGAVGQFEIRASLSEAEGRVNEPITLLLEIEGAGNIEILSEPPLPEISNWRLFESQPSTTVEMQEDVVYGIRRFERLMVPGQPGNYTIPSITFTYYDPQAEQYRTTSTEPIPIVVKPGETGGAAAAVAGSDNQPGTLFAGDIRHIKPVPTRLRNAGAPILTNPLYWGCWLLPLLVVSGAWVWQKQRQRFSEDTVYARCQTARRRARKILTEAQPDKAETYAIAQRALLGYLSDKLNQPTVGLTTAGLMDRLQAAQLDPALIEAVRSTLEQIDIGRFAPVEETAAQILVSETRQLIDNLEKAFEE